MAPWLIPALKTILPHVGTILTAATPVFTRKQIDASNEQARLIQQQIGELQSAASQNAAHVRELAEQLQSTVNALEIAALNAGRRMRTAVLVGGVAVFLSLLSMLIAIAALVR